MSQKTKMIMKTVRSAPGELNNFELEIDPDEYELQEVVLREHIPRHKTITGGNYEKEECVYDLFFVKRV